jgi:alkyldihydroxyacetonephosphate synthase
VTFASVPFEELVQALGAAAVVTDRAALDQRSHDSWPVASKWARQGKHPYPAEVVAWPASPEEVAEVLRIATRAGVPVTPWGLGSSVTGQPLPVEGGIVLDLSRMTGPLELNEVDLTVTVPAGIKGGELEDELQSRGYTLNNSPQSLYRSSVGGWLATLETGQFSSRYGGIEDLVCGYVVTLADGETIRLGASPRRAMGPDLRHLFLGSEGTLGVVTEVTMKVFPRAEHRVFEAIRMPSVRAGLVVTREAMARGLRPFLVRFYDADEARHAMQDESCDAPVLFLGTEGVRAVAEAEHAALVEIAHGHGGESVGPDPVVEWMERRFDFSAVEQLLDTDGGYAETIEIAHVWSRIEAVYDDLKLALAPLADEVLGHFSHAYTQGSSLYLILLGRARSDAEAEARLMEIWETAMTTCLRHGAELSHHHGGGLARSRYAARSLGSAHHLLQRVKDALDPEGVLNPGKLGLRSPRG